MKKKIVCKILIISIVTSMAIGSFAGCKTSETEGTGENISEVVSEEVSEALSEEVASDEVMGSEETSEETSSEASEEATEETTEETSSEKTSEEKTEEPSEEKSEEPAYTVEDMDAIMYAQKPVNVRKGPSTDYDKIGGLNQNDEVHVTGKASTGWYRIDYNGTEGFVANSYLGKDKVVAPPPTEKPPVEQPNPEQPAPDQPAPEQPAPEQPPSQEKYQVRVDYDMLALINQERAACGASQLVWNSSVEAAALERVKAIAESGQLSHDNTLAGTRGEIMLKRKSGNLPDMIEQYKGSPGHYGVMTTDGFSSMVSVSCGVWSELGQRINMYYNVVIFF